MVELLLQYKADVNMKITDLVRYIHINSNTCSYTVAPTHKVRWTLDTMIVTWLRCLCSVIVNRLSVHVLNASNHTPIVMSAHISLVENCCSIIGVVRVERKGTPSSMYTSSLRTSHSNCAGHVYCGDSCVLFN